MSSIESDIAKARLAERDDVIGLAEDAGCDPEWLAERMVALVAPLVGELIAKGIESLRNKALTSQRADDDEEQIAYLDGRIGAFRDAARIARAGEPR